MRHALLSIFVAAFVGAFVRTRYVLLGEDLPQDAGVRTLGSRWKRVPTQRHPLGFIA